MCGHCTERAALAERLAMRSTRGAVRTDPLLLPVHLQEAHDWRRVLETARVHDDLVVAIIALCRASSERVAGTAHASLRDVLDPGLHARLDRWLASLPLPAAWDWLRNMDGAAPAALPLDTARDELDAYLAGWLHLQAGDAPAWDGTLLHERLPRLSIALEVLRRDVPGDDRLVALALASPGANSPFSAIDLWLQRRATQAVIAHHGIGFVLPLLDRWRSGTLLAAVLRGDLDPGALYALQGGLAQRSDDGTEGTRDLRVAVAGRLAE